MSQPSSESVQAAVDNLLDALIYDGAHHKQEAAERALSHLVSPEEFKMLKDQYKWDEGIVKALRGAYTDEFKRRSK